MTNFAASNLKSSLLFNDIQIKCLVPEYNKLSGRNVQFSGMFLRSKFAESVTIRSLCVQIILNMKRILKETAAAMLLGSFLSCQQIQENSTEPRPMVQIDINATTLLKSNIDDRNDGGNGAFFKRSKSFSASVNRDWKDSNEVSF